LVLKSPPGEGGFQTLKDALEKGAVTLNYGEFLNSCLGLLLVALAMFVIIRVVNRVDKKLDEAFTDESTDDVPTEKKCEFCRSTIAYRATRCPQCTSQLAVPESTASAE